MSLLTICVFFIYMKVYRLLFIAAEICLQEFLSNYPLQTGQFAGQLFLLLDKFLFSQRLKFLENECCSKEVLVCLHEVSQTTCSVLWITEKFETRNTKSLHNKQYIQVKHPKIVFANTFPIYFSHTGCSFTNTVYTRELIGDMGWWNQSFYVIPHKANSA